MAGPTCEVLIESDAGHLLDEVDSVLSTLAEHIKRTRKGRVWEVWVGGRPVHVMVAGAPPAIELSAGYNDPEDYAVLERLSGALVERLGGVASPLSK
jgi:hypothetical protein